MIPSFLLVTGIHILVRHDLCIESAPLGSMNMGIYTCRKHCAYFNNEIMSKSYYIYNMLW